VATTANPVEIGRWGGGSYFVGIIDEAAIFKNVILEEGDFQTIMDKGLKAVLGSEAVSSKSKLTTTWGRLKSR
jgi:hypothetical protein